jgi:acetyl esterase/lipase
MKLPAVFAVLAVLSGGQAVEKKTPTFEEIVKMRVVWSVPGMDAVAVRRHVAYKTGDAGAPLHMDVYSPPGPARPRPAVILIHGGPIPQLGAKNMGVFLSYGELIAASGLVAVTFDHRFLGPARLQEAASDVADLVSHVRANASSLGIDPERIALWAFSGGGPFLSSALRDRPGWLKAVAAFYAVLDLQQPPPGAPDNGLSAETRTQFSPVAALGQDARSAPPILVARAGLDNPWLNDGVDRFVAAALSRGATLDLLTHPTGRHAFDILDDDARSKQIIRRAVEFLRAHLELVSQGS